MEFDNQTTEEKFETLKEYILKIETRIEDLETFKTDSLKIFKELNNFINNNKEEK